MARSDGIEGEHGAGRQATLSAVLILSPVKVWVPEQPLKLCPTVMLVSVSLDETVKLIGVPCAVVPVHVPEDDDDEGAVGVPHAAHVTTTANAVTAGIAHHGQPDRSTNGIFINADSLFDYLFATKTGRQQTRHTTYGTSAFVDRA